MLPSLVWTRVLDCVLKVLFHLFHISFTFWSMTSPSLNLNLEQRHSLSEASERHRKEKIYFQFCLPYGLCRAEMKGFSQMSSLWDVCFKCFLTQLADLMIKISVPQVCGLAFLPALWNCLQALPSVLRWGGIRTNSCWPFLEPTPTATAIWRVPKICWLTPAFTPGSLVSLGWEKESHRRSEIVLASREQGSCPVSQAPSVCIQKCPCLWALQQRRAPRIV